ncbi:MAG: S46 family peptidase [Chitinophagales bacterium]
MHLFNFQMLRADPPVEGMWLPLLLDQLTINDMQANGLQLSADDLYSVNHASMKDAVLLFGTGCTGEVVSEQGLVLTAHHCGLGQIQSHSSVEHDYLENGFWAMNRSEELACPGLKVTFIISIADVTSRVVSVLHDGIPEWKRNLQIDSVSKVIANENIAGTHYGAQIKPFYTGNQYFLFITETFRDIRLVGAPPVSIGNFGGETDNWIWPRHTGDFSVFRIYAGADNKPADYSPDNVPFRPRYYFPISLKGVKESDFTMVYGFPGTTNEYATSYAIDLVQNVLDPDRVKIRDKVLNTWWNDMLVNDTVRIQYLSKYNGLGNGWKKWQGESKGLKEAGAIAQKELYEADFSSRVAANDHWQMRYGTLLPQLKTVYDSLKKLQPLIDYYDEALNKPEIFGFANSFQPLAELAGNKIYPDETINKEKEKMKLAAARFFKNYASATDQKLLDEMTVLYGNEIGLSQTPATYREILKKYSKDKVSFANNLFQASFLDNQKEVTDYLNGFKRGSEKKLVKDPVYRIAVALNEYRDNIVAPVYDHLRSEAIILNRKYMAAQLEVMKERKFYPDANLSLRITYGKVEGFTPRDGVQFSYFTTLDGIMQKMNPDFEDYKVPERLKELYVQKDFGIYADASGKLKTCFIASNHTTGGASGAPVIDGTGNIIGINFDRVWEGTMSDLFFDPERCRNISLDIRYALFIIDKYAGAGYLLEEMKLVR